MPKSKAGRAGVTRKSADLSRAAGAIRAFLDALGLDHEDPALAQTPATVARAFHDHLIDGYRTSPEEALGRGFPIENSQPVAATSIPVMLMCPHHLMPARGVAHVAFIPHERVPGLGRIPRLIDALAHRLILQEDLSQGIVDALRDHFAVKAAVAVIEAEHTCVALEDFARRGTRFTTHASFGARPLVSSLIKLIDGSLRSSWPTSSSKPPSVPRGSKLPSSRARRSAAKARVSTPSPRRPRSRSGG